MMQVHKSIINMSHHRQFRARTLGAYANGRHSSFVETVAVLTRIVNTTADKAHRIGGYFGEEKEMIPSVFSLFRIPSAAQLPA